MFLVVSLFSEKGYIFNKRIILPKFISTNFIKKKYGEKMLSFQTNLRDFHGKKYLRTLQKHSFCFLN